MAHNTLVPQCLLAIRHLPVAQCLGLLGCLMLAGCPHGQPQRVTQPPPTLPNHRMAPDAVGLELGLAQLDQTQAEVLQPFWDQLDHQELSLELRQRLDENGLRAAVMASRPPPQLRQLVRPRAIEADQLTEFQRQLLHRGHLKPTTRMVLHEQVSNRQGQAHPIPTSEHRASYSWTIHDRGQRSVGAGSQVRGVISVATFPQGDGSVRLVVTPEIHHGEARDRFGASEHGFRFESKQQVIPLEKLRMEVTLRSGESLVLGPTPDLADLGELFFGNPVEDDPLAELDSLELEDGELEDESWALPELASDAEEPPPLHRLLMIRVVQTQLDDLFEESHQAEPLTSVDRY